MGTDPNSSRSEFIPVSCNHSLTRAFLGCLVTGGGGGEWSRHITLKVFKLSKGYLAQ